MEIVVDAGISSTVVFGDLTLRWGFLVQSDIASSEAIGALHLVQMIQPMSPVGKGGPEDDFGLVGILTPEEIWLGTLGIVSAEVFSISSIARTAVTRWPSCVRTSVHDSLATIIVPSKDNVFCRAHSDGSAKKISFTAGNPYTDGNGHPRDVAATYWGRCATCDRLFIVAINPQGYKRASHRVDVPLSADTYLCESSPSTAMAGETTILGSGVVASRSFPTLFVPVIDDLIPLAAHVIKGAISLCAVSADVQMYFQGYQLKRADVSKTDATWNEYKSGVSWNTVGALGDNTDRDTRRKSEYLVGLSSTGWNVISDGFVGTCLQELRTVEWAVTLYMSGNGTITFKSLEAVADQPYLSIWYEL
jgi:hypothetical protein